MDMLNFFKKKKDKELYDLDGNLLKEGDLVFNMRYDLGDCKIIKTDEGFEYESLATGKRVSWIRMIDAATTRQKVRLKSED